MAARAQRGDGDPDHDGDQRHERRRVEAVEQLMRARPDSVVDELLVKVHATTVNRTDCGVRGADPVIVRLFTGLTKPRRTIVGSEFAGEVEAVGRDVTSFAQGDAVFGLTGDGMGAHAEYLCVRESGLVAHTPTNVTHEQAAASCDGAMLALRA